MQEQPWIQEQLKRRGIRDPRVLDVMRETPREEFVLDEHRANAYHDGPLPIGFDVTISQPYIVALMTELLDTGPDQRVLEVGTGSGYQTAVLAQLAGEVFSIEVIGALAQPTAERLRRFGFANVQCRQGDGALGWPEQAPFDRIIVTAAPAFVPPALVDQLVPGGRLICPVGTADQNLVVVDKSPDGKVTSRRVIPVSFVPLVSG